jgi:hypothetical protein
VKNASQLLLVGKEGTVLKGVIDRVTETGRCYEMETNVEKTNLMRISRQSSPLLI